MNGHNNIENSKLSSPEAVYTLFSLKFTIQTSKLECDIAQDWKVLGNVTL
jgi:hypothetical protein